jgi:hypothetical protein
MSLTIYNNKSYFDVNSFESSENVSADMYENSVVNLSTDMYEKLFSSLEYQDLKSASLVNHVWNEKSVNYFNKKEFALLRNMVISLLEILDENLYCTQEQKQKLQELKNSMCLNSKNGIFPIPFCLKDDIRKILFPLLNSKQLSNLCQDRNFEKDNIPLFDLISSVVGFDRFYSRYAVYNQKRNEKSEIKYHEQEIKRQLEGKSATTTKTLNLALRFLAPESMIKWILKSGAKPTTKSLNIAAESLCFKGYTNIFKMLLNAGAVPDTQTLYYALFSQPTKAIIKLLLKKGVTPTEKILKVAKILQVSPEVLSLLKAAQPNQCFIQ